MPSPHPRDSSRPWDGLRTDSHSAFASLSFQGQFSSVTQLSSTLPPHGLQHTRLPCSSPTPGACSNSCPFQPSHPLLPLLLLPCHPYGFDPCPEFLSDLAEARLWPLLKLGLISSLPAWELVRGLQRNRTIKTYRDIYNRRFIAGIGSCSYRG